MDEPVIAEVEVGLPAEEVWRALRDPGEPRRWHGWDFDEGGGLDAEMREIYFGGAKADAGRLTPTRARSPWSREARRRSSA